jgi:hypothetical protein
MGKWNPIQQDKAYSSFFKGEGLVLEYWTKP